MVKDFSWNIIPWNALLFEKTLKQLSILNIKNYMSWHGETCGNKRGFCHYFLSTPMTDWASIFTGLLFYKEVVIHEVWAFGQYCLPMALKPCIVCVNETLYFQSQQFCAILSLPTIINWGLTKKSWLEHIRPLVSSSMVAVSLF